MARNPSPHWKMTNRMRLQLVGAVLEVEKQIKMQGYISYSAEDKWRRIAAMLDFERQSNSNHARKLLDIARIHFVELFMLYESPSRLKSSMMTISLERKFEELLSFRLSSTAENRDRSFVIPVGTGAADTDVRGNIGTGTRKNQAPSFQRDGSPETSGDFSGETPASAEVKEVAQPEHTEECSSQEGLWTEQTRILLLDTVIEIKLQARERSMNRSLQWKNIKARMPTAMLKTRASTEFNNMHQRYRLQKDSGTLQKFPLGQLKKKVMSQRLIEKLQEYDELFGIHPRDPVNHGGEKHLASGSKENQVGGAGDGKCERPSRLIHVENVRRCTNLGKAKASVHVKHVPLGSGKGPIRVDGDATGWCSNGKRIADVQGGVSRAGTSGKAAVHVLGDKKAGLCSDKFSDSPLRGKSISIPRTSKRPRHKQGEKPQDRGDGRQNHGQGEKPQDTGDGRQNGSMATDLEGLEDSSLCVV